MDYSVTFARHFSRLVWLLLNESANIEEQKAALRATVTVSKDGPVSFAMQEWRLSVNGEPVPEALTGVQDLTAQMIGHAVRTITVDKGAVAADLLGVARILAAEAVPGDGGDAVKARVAALGAKTVHIEVAGKEVLLPSKSANVPAIPAPGGPNAPVGASGKAPARKSGARQAMGAGGGFIGEDSGSYLLFSAQQQPKGSAGDLLQQLDATKSVNITSRLLDDLVAVIENAAREGKTDTVSNAFHGIVAREAATAEADLKRAYAMAIRRLTKPTLLRAVAQMMPRKKERIEDYMLVLGRCGEDGADALIDQLTSAQSLSDRRIFFDGLVKLNAGVPALIHMLGDARWYVARNAADLLGEMQAEAAQGPLSELLKHDDDRVRRAAITALAKLTSPKAVDSLRQAMRDSSPQVRMQAAAGMGGRKGLRSAGTLTKALDDEEDQEVQLSIIAALGRLATADAVQRLIKAAEPAGGIFKKKPTALRVAAVQALGEARTPLAQNALQHLLDDKDKEVKQAVFRLLMDSQAKKS
ncbi:MAG TPA: HEAT repeat domain-containing protein [Gemmatimonadaceae bacterium]|nr:HEAT repeat domain-containing protein [Gemmatimonadaceae bacterium]